jgi:hypothetical protein
VAEAAEARTTTKRLAIGVAAGLVTAAGIEVAKKLRGHENSQPEQSAATPKARPRERVSAERSPLRATSTPRKTDRGSKNAPRASRNGATTKEQLYRKARRLNVKGRSKMTKAELERAVQRAQR